MHLSSFSALVSFFPLPELRSAEISFEMADSRFIAILQRINNNVTVARLSQSASKYLFCVEDLHETRLDFIYLQALWC